MMSWSAPELPELARPVVRRSSGVVLPALTSPFGPRSDPIHGGRRLHAGIDIPGRTGTPVRASASGIVRFAGTAGGYGRMVEIAHGDGLSTRYAHLSRILVVPGQPVHQGEIVALVGATGRATGPHLHFEIRAGGRAVDPLPRLTGVVTLSESGNGSGTGLAEPHLSDFARARASGGGSTHLASRYHAD